MNKFTWGMLLLSLAGVVGCDVPVTKNIVSGALIPTAQAPESGYCSNAFSYADPTSTLEGFAKFRRRDNYGTFISGGLGAPGAPRPIRFAEVVVTNSAGAIIQCGETDGDGHYSLAIPRDSGSVKISVYARSDNAQLKAAVYDDPRYNNRYGISTTVAASNALHTLPDLIAEATGDVMGAAFNILDQFLEANIYLRSKVGNCNTFNTGCADFTVAPRVTAYWKLGFNPAEYYGAAVSGISYYIPGYYRLFILGGIDGDSNSSDTDHFDNSVILHEYGHFLEDALFTSDSPGGSHNGNRVIDPRLAWSEGWGNFFQAAVRNDPTYIDTEGNIDGSTGYLFLVNLEDQTRDIPENPGEGNFREFSITRFMWDIFDGTRVEPGGIDDISDRFVELYHSLRSSSGWMKASAAFRQIGLMTGFQANLGTDSWASVRAIESQKADTSDYAQYVAVGSSCVSFTMTPADLSSDNGSYATSHLLLNNDFYHLRIVAASTYTLTLDYQDADSSGSDADLDLFLYNENARFGNSEDMVGRSMKDPASDPTRAKSEVIHVNLTPGNYLINVMAFTGSPAIGGTANYSLSLNGSRLCPASLP